MIPGATPSGAGPAQPGSPDSGPDSEQPGQTVVTITDNGDGSYSVSCDDGDDSGSAEDQDSQPQTAKGIPAALKLAAQMLQGGGNPATAWNAEASTRDASGMPSSTPPPAMSM